MSTLLALSAYTIVVAWLGYRWGASTHFVKGYRRGMSDATEMVYGVPVAWPAA